MNLHKLSFLPILIIGVVSHAFCQNTNLKPYKSPPMLLQEGYDLYDEGKYEESITKYKLIDFRDKNFVLAQYEIALSLDAEKKELEAIEILRKGVSSYAKDNIDSYLLLANIEDKQYGLDSSLYYYDLGIKTFPFENKFYLDKAVAYYHVKNLTESLKNIQKSLELNFLDAKAHRYLAIVCFEQNQLSRGSLALWTYLLLKPNDSKAMSTITFCEPFIFEKLVIPPDSLMPYNWSSTFAKQDLLMKNQVAFNEKYELQSVHNYKIIRQFQLLMSQLKFDPKSDDFWMKNYVTIYDKVFAQNKYSMLTDYWLSGSILDAQKQYESNKKNIEAVADELIEKVKDINRKKTIPGYLKNDEVYVQLGNDGKITNVIENYAEGNYSGKILKINSNGKVIGKGTLNSNGLFTGLWEQIDENGKITQEVSYWPEQDSSAYITYAKNGKKIDVGSYKGDNLVGMGSVNYANGTLKIKASYFENAYDGKYESFHANGNPYIIASYTKGSLDGAWEEYFNTGKLKIKQNYINGKSEGKYEQFFENGKLNIQGEFLNDKLVGQLVYYFRNGNVSTSTEFKNGQKEGKVIQNYLNGQKMVEGNYKKDKKEDIETYYDLEGNPYMQKTYKEDKLVRVVGSKTRNKEIDYKIKKNQIEYIDFYSSGRLYAKGQFNNGLLEGMVNTYYPNGELQTSCNYTNGIRNGVFKSYAKYGYLEYEYLIENDTLKGEYRTYFPDGAIQFIGNYSNNTQEGQWLTYNNEGKILDDSFFIEGQLHAESYGFRPDGVLFDKRYYEDGVLNQLEQFDKSGRLLQKNKLEFGYGEIISKNLDGSIKQKGNFIAGKKDGEFVVKNNKGVVLNKVKYVLDQENGTHFIFNDLGKKNSEVEYISGQEQGLKKIFTNSGLLESEEFLVDNKREGLVKYYINGKLNLKTNYTFGEKNGELISYDFDGVTPGVKLVYENGFLVAYATPNLDLTWSPLVEIPQNQVTHIKTKYASGQPSFEATVNKGLFEGVKKEIGKNGHIVSLRNYTKFLNEGVSEEYYEDGKLLSSISYKNNNLNGPIKIYHKNGKLSILGNYLNNQLHGPYIYYNEKGEEIYKTNYYYGEED